MEMSFMNQSGTSLATRRALEPGVPLLRRRSVRKTRRQELEGKLATLQKDYAELHTAIFEAAQVHRRLCAPRLVRYGNFEIASEIFAICLATFSPLKKLTMGCYWLWAIFAARVWRPECGPRTWSDWWLRMRL